MQEGKQRAQLPFLISNVNDQPNLLCARAAVAIWTTNPLDAFYLVRVHGGILGRQHLNVLASPGPMVLPNNERSASSRHTFPVTQAGTLC